ncbi:TPA: hypothetical protein EYP70_05355, partial [Candidatus Bathyarchaeota archaeon]|nr:hypothetical protein [Candidatus Bathyarchaeota archaeon]
QKKIGGEPEKCVVYELLQFHLIEEDNNSSKPDENDCWVYNQSNGRFTPSLGDSGNMYAAGILPHPHLYETAYRWYKDFRYLLAKKLAKKLLSGGKSEKVYSNLFVKVSENLKNISEEICEPLGVKSFNFPAYGVAILQTGKKDNIIATTILYGRFFGHGHFDRLDLGIFAYGQVLLPDFGYPETCNPEDPRRFGFFSHTIGHNTVMVNQRRQQMEAGRLQTFDVTPNVKVVEVSAEDVYSGIVDCYRRNVMLVDAASSAYLIDVFRVEGGEQHDWIIHGTESEFTISGAPLSDAQREGTLAGKDVPYGQFYDDIIMRNSPYGTVSYSSYHGSGFQYLFNVQRAKIQKTCRVEWRCTGKGAERVNLTAFLVPKGTEELIICDGKPQNRLEMPETVKFVIRRRRGKDLSTVFVTVFEPYKEAPKIKRVDQLEIKPSDSTVIALKIEFPNFIDYYINAKDETKVYRIGQNIRFCGSLGLIRFNREGDVILAYLLNATELHCGNFSIRGSGIKHTKIANVDYRMGIITLTDPVLTRDLKGKWLIIHKNTYNSGYKIEEVINKKTFSIGNQSYIIGYATVQRINVKKGTIRTSMILPFAKPGMGLMSEDGQVKFKISSINKGVIKVEGNLSEKDFPDIDGDGKRTFYVVDFVVGDNVTIPSSILFTSPERNDDVSL